MSSLEDARPRDGTLEEASGELSGPLAPIDLFNALPRLAQLLGPELDRGAWLDAYLIAAGMSQLVDDQLQADVLFLRRTAAYLRKLNSGPAGLAARIARRAADVADIAAGCSPSAARARRLQTTLDHGLDALADLVVGQPRSSNSAALEELSRACQLGGLARARLPRALQRALARLPSCFRSFDQHPEDLRRLVADFTVRHADRSRAAPILVVGVRTSGSYLAPLYGALLREAGWRDVAVLSLRPGRRPHRRERARVRGAATTAGSVLVCDDPPVTGGSIVEVLADLTRMGVAVSSITVLLALLGDQPSSLAGYDTVTLPFERWSIHDRLAPAAIGAAVSELLGDAVEVRRAEPLDELPRPAVRGHLRAAYRLTVIEDGEQRECRVRVEGVGLGYLGRHALAVAEQLGEFLPAVLGVRDGLLFRELMTEEGRADHLSGLRREPLAARIAAYVLARRRLLAVEADSSMQMSGQFPAWEAASMVLSRTFGRGWPLGRVVATDRIARTVLAVRDPSVVDGRAELDRWFEHPRGNRFVKVDWDQGCSWNLGLASCDPVFDLAAVTAVSGDDTLERELRAAYQRLGGGLVESERWLLLQLAHLARPQLRRESRHAVGRARSRAMQRYYRDVFFADVEPSTSGPLCGLDIDGVLEGEYLGAPALTPASAIALRALHLHGYRPLVVTGRSLGEVIERAEAYRLPAGVAEYGSVIYEREGARVTVRLDEHELDELARVRAALAEIDGATLDEDYRYAIRAWRRDDRGRRRALTPDAITAVLDRAGSPAVTPIDGDSQTDFVAASVDKGRAVSDLAARLGWHPEGHDDQPLALAVGDTARDESLLAVGQLARAPAHARRALGGRYSLTRASYQAGLSEAVGALLGHRPGDCPRCRLPSGSRDRRLVLAQLAVGERGIRSVPWQTVRLAVTR